MIIISVRTAYVAQWFARQTFGCKLAQCTGFVAFNEYQVHMIRKNCVMRHAMKRKVDVEYQVHITCMACTRLNIWYDLGHGVTCKEPGIK